MLPSRMSIAALGPAEPAPRHIGRVEHLDRIAPGLASRLPGDVASPITTLPCSPPTRLEKRGDIAAPARLRDVLLGDAYAGRPSPVRAAVAPRRTLGALLARVGASRTAARRPRPARGGEADPFSERVGVPGPLGAAVRRPRSPVVGSSGPARSSRRHPTEASRWPLAPHPTARAPSAGPPTAARAAGKSLHRHGT